MIRAVIDRLEPGYSPADGSFRVFDESRVRIGARKISLNELEHEIIRPGFDEPRVHVALVCAARSRPPLPAHAYRAEDLDRELERKMRRFVNDPKRNRIDREGGRLFLRWVFSPTAGN